MEKTSSTFRFLSSGRFYRPNERRTPSLHTEPVLILVSISVSSPPRLSRPMYNFRRLARHDGPVAAVSSYDAFYVFELRPYGPKRENDLVTLINNTK